MAQAFGPQVDKRRREDDCKSLKALEGQKYSLDETGAHWLL